MIWQMPVLSIFLTFSKSPGISAFCGIPIGPSFISINSLMINKNRLCFSQCEQMVGMKLQEKNPSGTPLIRLFSLLHRRILLTNFTNLQVQNQGSDLPKGTELLPLSWRKKNQGETYLQISFTKQHNWPNFLGWQVWRCDPSIRWFSHPMDS